MKRATLSALPAPTLGQAEPADLTDRLLERDGQPLQVERGAGNPALPKTPLKRRHESPGVKRAGRQAPSGLATDPSAATATAPAESAGTDSAPTDSVALSPRPTHSLYAALAAADQAAQALQEAGRSAPARYELALRYRLDALAHHLQQVREFVDGLTAR